MSKVNIILPDQSQKTFDHLPTTLEVAESIGLGLAKDAVAGLIDGQLVDLRFPLHDGAKLEIVTLSHPRANEVIRHSAAHVMAQAVQELWPEVKVTIGPVIEDGFYYDFDSPHSFTDEDLVVIEKKMKEIIKQNHSIQREELSRQEAIERFEKLGERFKVELIQDLDEQEIVSIYQQGSWYDLCRGPHIQRTGQIKAFKLLSVAGSYWRGDEKREQLQRIYATAFSEKSALKEHLYLIEEAKKRDHRKLGKELKLFHFHPLSPGAPFFLPRGTIVYNALLEFMREQYQKFGYEEVVTPQIFDVELFKQSGHYDNYSENMYFTEIEERSFALKPMNCPAHCLVYLSDRFSYRDLPWRMADFGRLHRFERSGTMHGLSRVRTFVQDDAHMFCTMDQLQSEISQYIVMLQTIYGILGMNEYSIYLSTRPEKRMGSDKVWDQAEAALESALKELNLPYTVNPGDGAFYGPKLDIMFVDALKRPWQLGTLQCDFNMPEAFDLKYVGEDNQEHRPVILHRTILGSLERFIGVYLEHCGGKLPTWLAPVQIVILNVTDRVREYCLDLETRVKKLGARVKFDQRNEKLNYKIREAQLMRIPYMIIVGDREAENKQLSLRLPDGQTRNNIKIEDFLDVFQKDVLEKHLVSPYK